MKRKINYRLAETEQQFGLYYKKNLRRIYGELEGDRHKYIGSLIKRAAVSAAGILFFCRLYDFKIPENPGNGEMKTALILIIIMIRYLYGPFKNYRTATKNRTMEIILSFWGNFTYDGDEDIIGENATGKSELFGKYNDKDIDDSFSGEYKGTKVKVSEQSLHARGNKSDLVLFKGLMILLDFPKKFKGRTVVISKKNLFSAIFENPLLVLTLLPFVFILFLTAVTTCDFYDGLKAGTADMYTLVLPVVCSAVSALFIFVIYRIFKRKKVKTVHKVSLESLDFARGKKIMTDDQIEARYILTPVFMEKTEDIRRLFHGSAVDFSWFDNKMLIAVHTRKNLFETASLLTPALSYHKVREVVSQLYSVFSVIDIVEEKTSQKADSANAVSKP